MSGFDALDVEDFLRFLGEDPERGGLVDTPTRFLKAWQFWCSGYGQDPGDVLKTFEDGAAEYDTMVFQGSIPIFSTCEHHLAPFFGFAHIGYIPQGRIVGLSKMARLCEVFARRLQVQERLTGQIAEALMKHLNPLGVGVVLQCRHMCMESRGIQKLGTITTTHALRGVIKDDSDPRAEFLDMVHVASVGIKSL